MSLNLADVLSLIILRSDVYHGLKFYDVGQTDLFPI
jgi:hypothetical protein